jgi:hypothetical protein
VLCCDIRSYSSVEQCVVLEAEFVVTTSVSDDMALHKVILC